jgi:hypothetical protein
MKKELNSRLIEIDGEIAKLAERLLKTDSEELASQLNRLKRIRRTILSEVEEFLSATSLFL